MADNLISLFKLESTLTVKLTSFDSKKIKPTTDSFYLNYSNNTKYVRPNFTEIEGKIKSGETPKIILITAAGATGKSELTKYLSASLSIPIFDLAKHNPVASNSLTGLFYNTLGHIEISNFIQGLKSGSNTIIIDALDEGYIKTTINGFNSFLSEIGDIADESDGVPFIIMGRTQVLEHSWLFFQEKGINTSLLKIEPFTVEQASEFIDKQIGEQKYNHQYQLVRDYIINSVEGFFKNETDINKKSYNSFIGYAPVLLSISKLLSQTANYLALYQELQKANNKGVDLIISIIDYIIQREKQEKIGMHVLPELLKNRSTQFSTSVNECAYNSEEQCLRLLFHQLKKPITLNISGDIAFDNLYNEKINEWVKEHPFLEGEFIQNAVFESYIISIIIQNEKYEEIVYEYLNRKYKDSFVLFFIFNNLSKNRKVSRKFIQYLYSSLKSLDIQRATSQLTIEDKTNESDDNPINCDLEFTDNNNELYSFEVQLNKEEPVIIGNTLSNIYINAPVRLLLKGQRCEFVAPINICCTEIIVNTSEFVIDKSLSQAGQLLIECDVFTVDYSDGLTPSLINHLDTSTHFVIFSANIPDFPFVEYFSNSSNIQKVDPRLVGKYLKLRKIIMQFRSHSKGGMAKLKDKIEHRRVIGNDGIGRKVLDALIKNRVLTFDNILFYVDDQRMHEVLGVSYIDLKRKELNEKVREFLERIE